MDLALGTGVSCQTEVVDGLGFRRIGLQFLIWVRICSKSVGMN